MGCPGKNVRFAVSPCHRNQRWRMKSALLLCLLAVALAMVTPARTAQTENPAKQDDPKAQADSPVASPVEVESWTKPEPGWLYVLDVSPNGGHTGGRVWLVDPSSGGIVGSIRTSYHPDFALSPDGSRLYIASDTRVHSTEIAVIDTATGEVLGGQGLQNRVVPDFLPPFSTMAVSRDGAVLWVVTKPGETSNLAAIATATGQVLPGHPDMGHCEDGQFISFPNAGEVDFICPTTKKIQIVHVDRKATKFGNSVVLLPWNHKLGVGEAFPSPGSDRAITIVRGDGAVFQMDVLSQSFSPKLDHGDANEHVYPGSWPVSPDGRIYIGYNRSYFPNLFADEFRVFDTSSWKSLGTIKTSVPFWSAVVSNDGKRVYALAPQQRCILVIDAASMRQIGIIDVGAVPALALVAPLNYQPKAVEKSTSATGDQVPPG
jgi:DNA-binding beta-propeller fold protein YncE